MRESRQRVQVFEPGAGIVGGEAPVDPAAALRPATQATTSCSSAARSGRCTVRHRRARTLSSRIPACRWRCTSGSS